MSGNGKGPALSDDVTAFVSGWLTTGGGSITQRDARGDLNFDGITDIADWSILNQESPALAAAAFSRLANVPEPSTWLLVVFIIAQTIMMVRR